MEATLRKRLTEARHTLHQAHFWKPAGSFSIVLFLVIALIAWKVHGTSSRFYLVPAFILAVWIGGLAAIFWRSRQPYLDWHELAMTMEGRFPELKQSLVTAAQGLKDRDQQVETHSNYLQRVVWQNVLEHAEKTNWRASTDLKSIARGRLLTIPLLGMGIGLTVLSVTQGMKLERTNGVGPALAGSQDSYSVTIDPGNTEVERGTSLIVSARFGEKLPAQPVLWRMLSDEKPERIELKQRLEDPLFAAQLTDIQKPFRYRVEYDDKTSAEFQVEVFEYPQLVQADAQLIFPEYTRQPVKQLANTRRVSVVEGTKIDWQLQLNKPVTRAWLEDEEKKTIELVRDEKDPQQFHAHVMPEKDRCWQLHLVDDRQRTNQVSTDLVAQVVANRLPTIKAQVRGDLEASALEEVRVGAIYWDDFGLTRYGFEFSINANDAQQIVFGTDQAGGQNVTAESTIDFESLKAKPDDLVSYHFWAEDLDPSGNTRRIASDLYFVEVRHFEEIFRQGTQPGEGQQDAAQAGAAAGGSPTSGVLQLQKTILTGTWNLLRQQTTKREPAQKFPEDLQLLRESQEQAQSDVQELASRATDARSASIVNGIQQAMADAIRELSSAQQQPAESLSRAVAAEQRSAQGLLQLREHEHEVIRANRNSSSPANAQARSRPMQQQLQELQLEEDINRYESERQASQPADSPEERERRQIQSRLQDLARRQEDVNREMSNLQNELQLAKDEKDQTAEELQLKRLREHQQELLEEVDELAERMDRASDPQNWQQARDQLQQSRDRMQQSQEAAEQGQTGQALAAGTRAQQQLRQTADQLRQQSADQFKQQIDSLAQGAEQLEQQQQQLTDQLREATNARSPGLRGLTSSAQLQDRLQQQKKSLEQLLQELQNTIQNAESSEPLLARQLYETYQQAEKDAIQQKLDSTKQQLEVEQRDQASQSSEAIATDLRELREGIQRTGRDVLGSDLEAWRRAADELERLTSALRRESRGGSEQEGAEANERRERQEGQRSTDSGESPNEPSDALAEQQGNASDGSNTANAPETSRPVDAGSRSADAEATGENNDSQQPQSNDVGNRPSGQPGPEDPTAQEGDRANAANSSEGSRPGRTSGSRARSPGSDGNEASSGMNGEESGSGWDAARGWSAITGPTSEEWIDRLRDVEEILDDADFRSRAAQIRDRVREIRRESRRHSKEPEWSVIEELVASPLEELREAVAEEVLRRSGERNPLVPIDRDPVPGPYAERVREYYERLGSGQ